MFSLPYRPFLIHIMISQKTSLQINRSLLLLLMLHFSQVSSNDRKSIERPNKEKKDIKIRTQRITGDLRRFYLSNEIRNIVVNNNHFINIRNSHNRIEKSGTLEIEKLFSCNISRVFVSPVCLFVMFTVNVIQRSQIK